MEKETLSFGEIEQALKRTPALEDLQDARDYQLEQIMGDVEIPSVFSLRDKMSPVRSQGSRGTCVAHAMVAVSEYFNRHEFKQPGLDLSEEFAFKKIKGIDVEDYNYDGYGAYMRSGAKALMKEGTCLEKTLPYFSKEGEDFWKRVVVTPEMEAEAKLYRAKSYARVASAEQSIKKALVTTNAPLLAGFGLYESYRQAKTNNGNVPVPKEKEKYIGGHAMAIVGYNKNGLLVKNSWGSGWGDNGYLHWPWEALEHVYSVWSFVDLSNPLVKKEELIEINKKNVSMWAIEQWNKGLDCGILTESSKPKAVVTKEELIVFFDRLGLLDTNQK